MIFQESDGGVASQQAFVDNCSSTSMSININDYKEFSFLKAKESLNRYFVLRLREYGRELRNN